MGALLAGEDISDPTGDWHNSTKAHPCKNNADGCDQPECLQGSNAKCKALCDRLNLLSQNQDLCYGTCDTSCADTDDSIPCSECDAPDAGNCGYCGSSADCQGTGQACFTLPP